MVRVNYVGPQGFQGPDGPQGVQGQGCPGMQGVQGPLGPQGLNGYQGPQGFGPQGLQGIPGESGDNGEIGPAGPQGHQGPYGPQGPKGDQGCRGIKGGPGPQGPFGNRGTRGCTGFQGGHGPRGHCSFMVSRRICQKCVNLKQNFKSYSPEFVVPRKCMLSRFIAQLTVINDDECAALKPFVIDVFVVRAKGCNEVTHVVFTKTCAQLQFHYEGKEQRSRVTQTHFVQCNLSLECGDVLRLATANDVEACGDKRISRKCPTTTSNVITNATWEFCVVEEDTNCCHESPMPSPPPSPCHNNKPKPCHFEEDDDEE